MFRDKIAGRKSRPAKRAPPLFARPLCRIRPLCLSSCKLQLYLKRRGVRRDSIVSARVVGVIDRGVIFLHLAVAASDFTGQVKCVTRLFGIAIRLVADGEPPSRVNPASAKHESHAETLPPARLASEHPSTSRAELMTPDGSTVSPGCGRSDSSSKRLRVGVRACTLRPGVPKIR